MISSFPFHFQFSVCKLQVSQIIRCFCCRISAARESMLGLWQKFTQGLTPFPIHYIETSHLFCCASSTPCPMGPNSRSRACIASSRNLCSMASFSAFFRRRRLCKIPRSFVSLVGFLLSAPGMYCRKTVGSIHLTQMNVCPY